MKFIAIIGLALAGCAPNVYVKDGATTADYKHDKYDCAQLAGSTASGNPFIYNSVMKDCMINKYGWRPK